MNKFVSFLIIVLVIVVVILGGMLFWQKGDLNGSYSAVYLKTGDLYFGKLSHFPSLTLSDVWFLQRSADGQSVSVDSFQKSIWGPENTLRLNKDEIVWTVSISKDSKILPIIKGEKTVDNSAYNTPMPTPSSSPDKKKDSATAE